MRIRDYAGVLKRGLLGKEAVGLYEALPVSDQGLTRERYLRLVTICPVLGSVQVLLDARTMEIHYTKHHQAYINNANNLLKDQPALAALPVNALIADLSKVPEAIRTGLRNNAGGHSNHSFFWLAIGPGKGGAPKGKLASAIDSTFGSFDRLKEEFGKAATTRFDPAGPGSPSPPTGSLA